MKHVIAELVKNAALKAYEKKEFSSDDFPEAAIDVPKIPAHGDFATNFALASASKQKMPPARIAQIIIENIDDTEGIIERIETAGPGFINFFIKKEAWTSILGRIKDQRDSFGKTDFGSGTRVQVEFVSANPTGPLHVGHGRGAVVGDAVASILSACGFEVDREYYINDAGLQIQTLGESVYSRALELLGVDSAFPENGYKGEYIYDIAREVIKQTGKEDLPSMAREAAVRLCADFAAEKILAGIRKDLKALGVDFDNWFSEKGLYESGKVDRAIEEFREKGLVYEKDGALWFASSRFGDDKDRVIVRQNGQTTYFASDIAYHSDKFKRGYDRIIDVWGADHHGYVPRLSAAVMAMGKSKDALTVILTNLVNLLRKGKPVAMSTRAGKFVTLKEVIDEVGKDAARFIFLTRHHESPLDFDLEVAKAQTNENPVYYVQYVHARISSIIKKGTEKGIDVEFTADPDILKHLSTDEDASLLKLLWQYPEVISTAARLLEPHRVAFYLMDLAAGFHAYYNKHRVLTDDQELTRARSCLVLGVKTVIKNGLTLLGVDAPESM